MRWRVGLLAAVALLAGSCGTASTQPVSTPRPTAGVSPPPTATASSSPRSTPISQLDREVVYFARDRLAPVAAHVDGAGTGTTTQARTLSRLAALFSSPAPRGLFNAALSTRARPARVDVEDELLTVDFTVPSGDWGVQGSAALRAFLQQLVFTTTEEPGIRRALFTENGGVAIIGGEGLVVDHPVTREDVSGYALRGSTEPMVWRADRGTVIAISSTWSVDTDAPALARFVIDTGLRGAAAKASLGFTAAVMRNDDVALPDLGKWTLAISVPATTTTDDPLRVVGHTPLRAVKAARSGSGTRYEIGLDDLRPWRVAMLYEPLRLVVDVGGDPDTVSANIALYAPAFGATVAPGGAASGMIRAFEGRYEYRITDARGHVVSDDFATASLGTSEMWGTFALPLPAVPAGPATLEILLRSPRDGEVSESVFVSFVAAP